MWLTLYFYWIAVFDSYGQVLYLGVLSNGCIHLLIFIKLHTYDLYILQLHYTIKSHDLSTTQCNLSDGVHSLQRIQTTKNPGVVRATIKILSRALYIGAIFNLNKTDSVCMFVCM